MYTSIPYILEGEIVGIQNTTSPINYVCRVRWPNGSDSLLGNVVSGTIFGGIADYFQIRSRASTDNGDQTTPTTNNAKSRATIGDRVYIQFVAGNVSNPVITGYVQHPNQTQEYDNAADLSPQSVLQYLGMRFEFPDTGALRITHLGAPTIKQVAAGGLASGLASALAAGLNPAVTPAAKSKTTFLEFYDDGGIQVRDSLGQLFSISTTDKQILISNNDAPSTLEQQPTIADQAEFILFDRGDKSLALNARSLLSLTSLADREDLTKGDYNKEVHGDETSLIKGDREVRTDGDQTYIVHGDLKDTVSGDYTLSIQGDQKVTVTGDKTATTNGDRTDKTTGTYTTQTVAGAKLVLDAATVALGAAGTEVLKTLSVTIHGLLDTLKAISAMTVPTALGPSGPPINAASFTQVTSQLTTLKGKLDTITGSL